jgi:DnaK suppressor protein
MFPTPTSTGAFSLALALFLSQPTPAHAAGPAPPAPASSGSVTPRPVDQKAKNAMPTTLSSPQVVLSARQRALLAAKNAAVLQGRPAFVTPSTKPAPAMTILASVSHTKPHAPPPGFPVATLRPASGAGTSSAHIASADADTRALDLVRAALGPETAKRVGLAKTGDRVSPGSPGTKAMAGPSGATQVRR